MRTTKALRELSSIAQSYGVEFDGFTGKSHLRWKHVRSGRKMVTPANLTSYKSLLNCERDFKRLSGAING